MAQGQNTQLAQSLVAGITNALVRSPEVSVEPSDIFDVKGVVQDAVAQSEIGNKLNMESFYQSRVFVGIAVSAVATILKPFGVDVLPDAMAEWTDAGAAAVQLAGLGYAAYGRFWPGLKPLFSRKA